ncbi:hypothetical protein ARAM_003547 [Aspergillus rambellii]|uniref:GRF-type domain-containing protein n=2 Tax=Aspergillus subgen. Nidulantes TaxID=2720870 RepID=A0A0F8U6H0_9EURO|nr:hypothetical protein AOCH_006323 [Aspergillus ochraceoroseus]KKK15349.1 hypothetical protein ARAM_003547 [Aspergillus rambellii]
MGSPRTAAPLRGLFLDGVWRCNCPGRPPALKLQTKNHGVNHGRWFYTCQQDYSRRCNFFLWASDAEAREKLTVLANSHSESSSTPRTPSKRTLRGSTTGPGGLLTPQTGQRDKEARSSHDRSIKPDTNPRATSQTGPLPPPPSAKARMMSEDADEFEWDDTVETEMGKLLDPSRPLRQPDFGRPPKNPARTENIPPPRKRRRGLDAEEGEGDDNASGTATPGSFAPPHPTGGGPFLTPTPGRYKNMVPQQVPESPLASSSELAVQVSQILEKHSVVVPQKAQDELRGLFHQHGMKVHGIMRGRDVSRVSLRKRDEQIARLNERIASLESQRELNRSVMGGSYKGK